MYAIVDIETTGGHASANGITEVAVFLHDGERITGRYQTLVNPGYTIPHFITTLTGITNAMVASAPTFEEVAGEIFDLLQGKIFVAHNVNFDFSFLKHHLKSSGYDLKERKLCTVRLSRKVFLGLPSYSLGSLCRHLDIKIRNRHRAEGDAEATVALFDLLLQKGGELHISDMLKRNSGEQWLPVQLPRKEVEDLPGLPGVYYFHDSKGKIVYVGKAVNLKKRITSHFTGNDAGRKRQNLVREVCSITYNLCASELHALVLESTEIKRLWPKYNKSQKQPNRKYALYSFIDNKGFTRLAIDLKRKNLASHYCFHLLQEGRTLLEGLVSNYGLDRRLCFLDRTEREEHELFLETPEEYNLRVRSALEGLEMELPTYAIMDNGVEPGKKLCILVDKGVFWGMGYIDSMNQPGSLSDLKSILDPYADNEFIRNSIYSFALANPAKKITFNEMGKKKRVTEETLAN